MMGEAHLVSWSLQVLLITCSPVRRGGRTHQCLSLCEKFGAGPYWARSCRLLLKLSVMFGAAASVDLSPSTSLSSLVSGILLQWIIIFPSCPAEPETLIFVCFLFSTNPLRKPSSVLSISTGCLFHQLVAQRGWEQLFSALFITTLVIIRKTSSLRAILTTLSSLLNAQVCFLYCKKMSI